MPGFAVRNVGNGPPVARQPKTKYSWHINQVFGNRIPANGQRAFTPVIYARDCTLPTMAVKIGTTKGASIEYKHAQAVCFDDVRVSWYDTIGLRDIMKEWSNSVWTPETGIRPISAYKKETRIRHYDYVDSAYDLWILHNSWPSRVAAGALSYVDNDINLVEVTVTYDWATNELSADFGA